MRSAIQVDTTVATFKKGVGVLELEQATTNLKLLEASCKVNQTQLNITIWRTVLLGDLEFRGHVRPITEEFNLAANFHKGDVCHAEFYRTFCTATFFGAGLLRRLRAEKEASGIFTLLYFHTRLI